MMHRPLQAAAPAQALPPDPLPVDGAVSLERLDARGIHVRFDGLAALSDVSLQVRRKGIVGLIGPNGSGKTTLVNVLSGFQKPTAGSVAINGCDVTGWAPHRIARHGVSRTFQAVRLFKNQTVQENLEVAAIGGGCGRAAAAERARHILGWLSFHTRADARAGSLPYGSERRVGIGRALAIAPKFLLLDEPAAGLNDAECDELMSLITRIPGEFGCGVVLIEHNMRVIMGVCERIHVINSGKTIADGTPRDVQRDPQVIRAYLGTRQSERPR